MEQLSSQLQEAKSAKEDLMVRMDLMSRTHEEERHNKLEETQR
jgi:hypothetical protein